jgi:hypothetical protein
MITLKKTLSSALAALTLGCAILAPTAGAEARGYRGGAIAAGVIGGLALGAIAAQAAQAKHEPRSPSSRESRALARQRAWPLRSVRHLPCNAFTGLRAGPRSGRQQLREHLEAA